MDKKINIMIIDDSVIIQKIFGKILEPNEDFEIVENASNGEEALKKLVDKKLSDNLHVIILDLEMPVMDGITALPKIRALAPKTKIIVASTLSMRGAEVSLKALELGATDYLPKPSISEDSNALETFSQELVDKVRTHGRIARSHFAVQEQANFAAATASKVADSDEIKLVQFNHFRPRAIAVGSSTGGPDALKNFFSSLDAGKVNAPIFITQHMPPHFTSMLAANLDTRTNFQAKEAENGEVAKPGVCYLAPGDFHMQPENNTDGGITIRLNQNEQENFCRPAVDPMLRSLSNIYGKSLLTVILTGMGSDGCKGGEYSVERGGTVFAQDKGSSVVWGMPGAVAEAGVCSKLLPPEQLAQEVNKLF